MGKQLKDLTAISLPIETGDMIFVERSNKGYYTNLNEILSNYTTIDDVQSMIDTAITTILNADF